MIDLGENSSLLLKDFINIKPFYALIILYKVILNSKL